MEVHLPEREIWAPDDLVDLILEEGPQLVERAPDPPAETGSAYFDPVTTTIAALAIVGNVHSAIELGRLVARAVRKQLARKPTSVTVTIKRGDELHRLEFERAMSEG